MFAIDLDNDMQHGDRHGTFFKQQQQQPKQIHNSSAIKCQISFLI